MLLLEKGGEHCIHGGDRGDAFAKGVGSSFGEERTLWGDVSVHPVGSELVLGIVQMASGLLRTTLNDSEVHFLTNLEKNVTVIDYFANRLFVKFILCCVFCLRNVNYF